MAMNNSQPEGTSNNRGYNQIYRPNKPKVKGAPVPMKPGTKTKSAPPVLKKSMDANKKKAALGSMLGSLSSGASFRNQ